MFPAVFTFLLSCIVEIFSIMNGISIAPGLSFLGFLICLQIALLVIHFLKSIRSDMEEEQRWLRNKERNKEYNEYQSWLKRRASDKQ